MRRSPLLLVLAIAVLLPAGVADAKPKRCGKQAITVGPKKRPTAPAFSGSGDQPEPFHL